MLDSDRILRFYDLIYAGPDVEAIIRKKYPNARIEDASDFIHQERFELEIGGISEDEFYPFAISEGFVRCCFAFELLIENGPKHNETIAKIKKWCEKAKEKC